MLRVDFPMIDAKAIPTPETAMKDLFDNPMGLQGFEFVEFASPTAGLIEPYFEMLGFTLVARNGAARHDRRRLAQSQSARLPRRRPY